MLQKNVDCLYIIVEPTIKSVQTAQHIKSLAEKLKIPQIIFVANKIISSQNIDFINQQLKNKMYKYINYNVLLVKFEQKKILFEQTNFYQQIKNEFCKIYPERK